MPTGLAKHRKLTTIRANAFEELFGCEPSLTFPSNKLSGPSGRQFLIDVLAYPLNVKGQESPVFALVTNGMSDQRMADGGNEGEPRRRELIQYLRSVTPGHAQRLRDMAWLPLFDGFHLGSLHSVAWPHAAVDGTPWTNAFFVESIVRSHREFSVELDGDSVSLLWHVPISEGERALKQKLGANALLDRMDKVGLPWVFDEANRPSLV